MRLWFLDNEEPFLLRALAREFALERFVCSGGPERFMVGGRRRRIEIVLLHEEGSN
jgi:hypothetical protein